ncbi:unnamed protein product [Protopolystoma xenopodis]|uniref:Uncharacterized protein n=1 Tax=Protopolystoma xenopodis TaxID=117903 RepID=A0A3S5CRL3_9PLAT|nr:unnamed protein product [Protopolystoma xenopodis]
MCTEMEAHLPLIPLRKCQTALEIRNTMPSRRGEVQSMVCVYAIFLLPLPESCDRMRPDGSSPDTSAGECGSFLAKFAHCPLINHQIEGLLRANFNISTQKYDIRLACSEKGCFVWHQLRRVR